MLWHLWIILDCSADWGTAKHDLTFLVAHPFLFAPAIGLIFSTIDDKRLGKRAILFLVTAAIIVAGIITWINQSRPPQNQVSVFLGAFETAVFMIAIVAFIFYCFAVIWSHKLDTPTFARFCLAAVLFALWIPLRVYADLSNPVSLQLAAIKRFFAEDFGFLWLGGTQFGTVGPQAMFGLVVAILVFTCFAIIALVKNTGDIQKTIASVAGAVGVLISMTLVKNVEWVPPVQNLIMDMGAEMFVALGVIAFLMILSLAKFLLPS
jgi:hypothetical protein